MRGRASPGLSTRAPLPRAAAASAPGRLRVRRTGVAGAAAQHGADGRARRRGRLAQAVGLDVGPAKRGCHQDGHEQREVRQAQQARRLLQQHQQVALRRAPGPVIGVG